MSKISDDLCAEIRRQCEAAEHFKNLWMQANDELERAKQELAMLKARQNEKPEQEPQNKDHDLAECIKQKVIGRLALRGFFVDMSHSAVRITAYELLSDIESVMAQRDIDFACHSEAIKVMVNRFLCWKLPQTFGPDCGISFDGRKDDEWNKNKMWPTGTNLFNAVEARAMFEYCLNGDKA